MQGSLAEQGVSWGSVQLGWAVLPPRLPHAPPDLGVNTHSGEAGAVLQPGAGVAAGVRAVKCLRMFLCRRGKS